MNSVVIGWTLTHKCKLPIINGISFFSAATLFVSTNPDGQQIEMVSIIDKFSRAFSWRNIVDFLIENVVPNGPIDNMLALVNMHQVVTRTNVDQDIWHYIALLWQFAWWYNRWNTDVHYHSNATKSGDLRSGWYCRNFYSKICFRNHGKNSSFSKLFMNTQVTNDNMSCTKIHRTCVSTTNTTIFFCFEGSTFNLCWLPWQMHVMDRHTYHSFEYKAQ